MIELHSFQGLDDSHGLDDQFSASVMYEPVGQEYFTLVEGSQVVDIDLSGLNIDMSNLNILVDIYHTYLAYLKACHYQTPPKLAKRQIRQGIPLKVKTVILTKKV